MASACIAITVAFFPYTVRWQKNYFTLNNEHITNPQELLNLKYAAPSALLDDISQIVGDALCLITDPETIVMSANWVCLKIGMDPDVPNRNRIARMFNGLSTSQTFPYNVEITRKRTAQLTGSETQKLPYLAHASASQGMFTAYLLTKKSNV